MNTRRLLICAALTAFAVACGAGQQPASAPAQTSMRSDASSSAPRPSEPGARSPSTFPTDVPSAPSGMPVAPTMPSAFPTSRLFERERIVQELTQLQKGLDLSLSAGARQCDLACRALTSMEKAVEKLCRMADGNAEQQQCEVARGKLREATTHVRAECGECVH